MTKPRTLGSMDAAWASPVGTSLPYEDLRVAREAVADLPGAPGVPADAADAADAGLARALAAGDVHAFQSLVERETPRVFRVCYRVLGRVDEAEEATQEAFVLAYRALATFRGDGPAGAWLARIAARESWRRASARARRLQQVAPLPSEAPADAVDDRGPLDEAIAAEERERVRRAVARLPEPYREIVTLRYFAELTLAEIGEALDRPEGTVKAQLHRGLQRLRLMLGGSGQ